MWSQAFRARGNGHVPAAQRESPKLDEKLYLEVFAPPDTAASRRKAAAR